MLKLKVQTLFYQNEPGAIHRFLTSLLSLRRPENYQLWLNLGDCSERPLIHSDQLENWKSCFSERGWQDFNYTFFNENLGFSKGHNRLYFETGQADRLLLINPDGVVPFHLLERLDRFSKTRPDWGIVEARQIPFEHPKAFDQVTLETSFASGACSMLDATLFEQCGGFDETFFMYVEDVDLSWRIRALGRKIYFALDTFFYHSKHVDKNGLIMSDSEKYYGRLGWLVLRAKYGRMDLVEPVLEELRANPAEGSNARLLADWYKVRESIIPATTDQLAVATFQDNGNTAPLRWSYV